MVVRQLELLGQLQQPGVSPEEQRALWAQVNAVTAELEQLFARAKCRALRHQREGYVSSDGSADAQRDIQEQLEQAVGADEQGEGLGVAQAGEDSSEEEGLGMGAAQAACEPPAEAGAADPKILAEQLPAFGAPQEDAGQPAGQPEQSEWAWPVGVWLGCLHCSVMRRIALPVLSDSPCKPPPQRDLRPLPPSSCASPAVEVDTPAMGTKETAPQRGIEAGSTSSGKM